MFLYMSVCPQGEYLGSTTPREGTPPGRTPPGQAHPTGTPPSRHNPPTGTSPQVGTPPRQLHPPQAGTPPEQVHPPGQVHHPLAGTPGQVHPPAGTPPHHSACWDTVNMRAVRIPLECILVEFVKLEEFVWNLQVSIIITIIIEIKFGTFEQARSRREQIIYTL